MFFTYLFLLVSYFFWVTTIIIWEFFPILPTSHASFKLTKYLHLDFKTWTIFFCCIFLVYSMVRYIHLTVSYKKLSQTEGNEIIMSDDVMIVEIKEFKEKLKLAALQFPFFQIWRNWTHWCKAKKIQMHHTNVRTISQNL